MNKHIGKTRTGLIILAAAITIFAIIACGGKQSQIIEPTPQVGETTQGEIPPATIQNIQEPSQTSQTSQASQPTDEPDPVTETAAPTDEPTPTEVSDQTETPAPTEAGQPGESMEQTPPAPETKENPLISTARDTAAPAT